MFFQLSGLLFWLYFEKMHNAAVQHALCCLFCQRPPVYPLPLCTPGLCLLSTVSSPSLMHGSFLSLSPCLSLSPPSPDFLSGLWESTRIVPLALFFFFLIPSQSRTHSLTLAPMVICKSELSVLSVALGRFFILLLFLMFHWPLVVSRDSCTFHFHHCVYKIQRWQNHCNLILLLSSSYPAYPIIQLLLVRVNIFKCVFFLDKFEYQPL